MTPINQNLSLTFKPTNGANWSSLGKLQANALNSNGTSATPLQLETFTAGHQTSATPSPSSKAPASSNWGSPGQLTTPPDTPATEAQQAEPASPEFSLSQPQVSSQTPSQGACMGPLLCEQDPLLPGQSEAPSGPSPQFLANLAAENQSTMLNTWTTLSQVGAENRTTAANIGDINATVAQDISDMQMQGYLKRVAAENKHHQQMVYLLSEEWPET